MLTTTNTGLVQGIRLEPDTTGTHVRALRGFYDQQGQLRNPGELVNCGRAFAQYLIQMQKAELVPQEQLPPPAPALPPPASEGGNPALPSAEEGEGAETADEKQDDPLNRPRGKSGRFGKKAP